MTDGKQLVEAISQLVRASEKPIPISLMNHTAAMAHEIIVAVVEESAAAGIDIQRVRVDPSLAAEMGLRDGAAVSPKAQAILALEPGLERQMIFERLPAAKLN